MAGQKPREGWIYIINPNPKQVTLECRQHHVYTYNLPEPGNVECKHPSCKLEVNSSRVFRGTHPYIIWTSKQFQNKSNYIDTFTVIPLSSKETYKGLPTTYPIRATTRNSLNQDSFALVHQITTVDANCFCFKNQQGNWLNRIGQIDGGDKRAIEERLRFFLGILENPSDDWFTKNANPELLKKTFIGLSEDEKRLALDELIDLL